MLVGDGISVKISDFGLSRSLAKENTYYHLTEAKKLPVKWMALECLLFRKFSTYSDGKLSILTIYQICRYMYSFIVDSIFIHCLYMHIPNRHICIYLIDIYAHT